MKRSMIAVLASAVTVGLLAAVAHAGTFNAAYWGEAWTDASGTYHSPDQTKISVSGGQLIGSIPTDAVQTSPYNDVVNYVRTYAALPGASTQYNGSLLGDLSGKTSLTATFSLNNSTLGAGAQFLASEFVGGTVAGSSSPTPSLRLFFMDNNLAIDGSPNMWWSNGNSNNYISATSMNNGEDVTLTVSLDPSQWSSYNGQFGNSTPAWAADFESTLTDVSRLGISFGSGYFFSDGFAFNTGGTASLDIASINTLPNAVPEPISMIFFGTGLVAVGGYVARRRMLRKA